MDKFYVIKHLSITYCVIVTYTDMVITFLIKINYSGLGSDGNHCNTNIKGQNAP